MTPLRGMKLRIAIVGGLIVVAAAGLWIYPWVDFQRLRMSSKSSIVLVSSRGEKTSFSLNGRQTHELLDVVERLTETTIKGQSVIYREWADIYCLDTRSRCRRRIWVHSWSERDSADVVREVHQVAARGRPVDPESIDPLWRDASMLDRIPHQHRSEPAGHSIR